ncbi:MAG: hypothetical protein ABH837_03070 [bacterium]
MGCGTGRARLRSEGKLRFKNNPDGRIWTYDEAQSALDMLYAIQKESLDKFRQMVDFARSNNIHAAGHIFFDHKRSIAYEDATEKDFNQLAELIEGAIDAKYSIIHEPWDLINPEEAICPALLAASEDKASDQ